jgi:hypothetical protein
VGIAQGKPAYQDSTYYDSDCGNHSASYAVDGDTSPLLYQDCTCSHTDDGLATPMWWLVDLLQTYIVNRVQIYNRAEDWGKAYHEKIEALSS